MLFEDDVTVTFSMNAFNRGGRYIHVMGTAGEIHAALDGDTPISLYDFRTKKTTEIPVTAEDGITHGHGGGDEGTVETLYEYLNGEYQGFSVSDIQISVENHMLAFAAEESRKTGQVVDMREYLGRFQV